jgi:phage replication initiation protein
MNLTKIDWYGFRTQVEIPKAIEALGKVFGLSGHKVAVNPRRTGWKGYTQAADICLGDMHVGLMAFGGEHQKGWVSVNISGRGCDWVSDWEQAESNCSELPAYETRRVDIALDTYKQEVTHEKVLDAHRAGLFKTGGKPPKLSQILPEDPQDGRTIYIGDRTQGKFLRAYEKGFEMVKGLRKKHNVEISFVDDVPIADIYRLELELKPKNGPLPEDLIQRRDQYFSGAYPYLQNVIEVEPEVFSQSRERGPQRDLEAALEHIRYQFGSTLFTALACHHGDVGAVWDKIVGYRHNQRLLQAGVLLVDHDSCVAGRPSEYGSV